MFLDFFALGLLVFVGLTLFYGIIAIHDIPYEIAKSRNHPQQDALHVAGWVSLFTLHVLWPFLWIWATLYREDRGWGFVNSNPQATEDTDTSAPQPKPTEPADTATQEKVEKLEQQLQLLQRQVVLLSRQNQIDESSANKEQ